MSPSGRTPDEIRAGLVVDTRNRLGQRFVRYEPGTGARYDLLLVDLTPLGGEGREAFAAPANSWLLVWANPTHALHRLPSVIVTPSRAHTSQSYLSRKLGAPPVDAEALSEVLPLLLE